MNSKKIVLLGMMLFAASDCVVGIDFKYESSVPKLYDLEKQKIEKVSKLFLSYHKEFDDSVDKIGQQFEQQLMPKFMMIFAKYSDLFEDIIKYDQGSDYKAVLQTLSNRIKDDEELTDFAKNLVVFACKWGEIILEDIKKEANFAGQDVLIIGSDLIPQHIDSVQIVFDYVVSSYSYLEKQFKKNGSLTDDDMAHIVKHLGDFIKFPKKGHAAWNELISILHNGLKYAPQEVRVFVFSSMNEIMRRPDLKFICKLLQGTADLRREVVKTNGMNQEKLAGYGRMVDLFIAQLDRLAAQSITKAHQDSKQNVTKNEQIVKMISKMLFKN